MAFTFSALFLIIGTSTTVKRDDGRYPWTKQDVKQILIKGINLLLENFMCSAYIVSSPLDLLSFSFLIASITSKGVTFISLKELSDILFTDWFSSVYRQLNRFSKWFFHRFIISFSPVALPMLVGSNVLLLLIFDISFQNSLGARLYSFFANDSFLSEFSFFEIYLRAHLRRLLLFTNKSWTIPCLGGSPSRIYTH